MRMKEDNMVYTLRNNKILMKISKIRLLICFIMLIKKHKRCFINRKIIFQLLSKSKRSSINREYKVSVIMKHLPWFKISSLDQFMEYLRWLIKSLKQAIHKRWTWRNISKSLKFLPNLITNAYCISICHSMILFSKNKNLNCFFMKIWNVVIRNLNRATCLLNQPNKILNKFCNNSLKKKVKIKDLLTLYYLK